MELYIFMLNLYLYLMNLQCLAYYLMNIQTDRCDSIVSHTYNSLDASANSTIFP